MRPPTSRRKSKKSMRDEQCHGRAFEAMFDEMLGRCPTHRLSYQRRISLAHRLGGRAVDVKTGGNTGLSVRLAGPTGRRSPMRDGTDGDKYKPSDSARLLSEVRGNEGPLPAKPASTSSPVKAGPSTVPSAPAQPARTTQNPGISPRHVDIPGFCAHSRPPLRPKNHVLPGTSYSS